MEGVTSLSPKLRFASFRTWAIASFFPSALPSSLAAVNCWGSSFSCLASLPKPKRLLSFFVPSTTRPETAAASAFAAFFCASFSAFSAASLFCSAILWADSALSCWSFAFSASSLAFCSLYCIAVRCFLSDETPRSMPSTSAVMVCISAMSCRESLRLSPRAWFVQSATRWAWRFSLWLSELKKPSSLCIAIWKIVMPKRCSKRFASFFKSSMVVPSSMFTTASLIGVAFAWSFLRVGWCSRKFWVMIARRWACVSLSQYSLKRVRSGRT